MSSEVMAALQAARRLNLTAIQCSGRSPQSALRRWQLRLLPSAPPPCRSKPAQIRGMLRAPEVVVATLRAAQPECEGLAEDEVHEALAVLDPLWAELFPAEQSRVTQLLVERVDIGTDGLRLKFRDKGLAQMVTEVGMIAGKNRKAAA
jgi:hypothetical protein